MRGVPKLRHVAAWTCALILAACGGTVEDDNDDNGGGSTPQTTIRFALADAPACGLTAVNVTVDRVRVHQNASAGEGDNGWSEVVVSPPRRVDLLSLTNGVLEELGSTSVPAGTYTQMRLVLVDNSSANPTANTVIVSGTEFQMATPSAQQSGLKVSTQLEVPQGQVGDFVIDFDACQSVVPNSDTGFVLKPVLAVLPRGTASGMRVEGTTVPAGATGDVSVSLQRDGVVVRSTTPDGAGSFVLSPVPVGTYDLVVTAQGLVTAVVTGVPVASDSVTTVNRSTEPILTSFTTIVTVSGTVLTSGSSTVPDATVRARQTLVGGPTIELTARPVNTATGDYVFFLPAGPPVKAGFVRGSQTLRFSEDTAAAGQYTLEASVPGKPAQTASISLLAGNVVTPFTFAP